MVMRELLQEATVRWWISARGGEHEQHDPQRPAELEPEEAEGHIVGVLHHEEQ